MSDSADKVYLIAEAGVNHNGSRQRALEMIDAAADAGADAIKFQTFIPAALASANAGKADYQLRNEPKAENQLSMLQRLSLDFDAHFQLLERCRQRDIDFLSSPFDSVSADFLVDHLKLRTIKLGSGELTNAPLLWQIARTGVSLILSTGMSTIEEIKQALGVCCLAIEGEEPRSAQHCANAFSPEKIRDRVTIMHCTTDYPCPYDEVNLRAMDTLHEQTGLSVGYSDHTPGIAISLAAVARGARLIEKHFTLNKTLSGPDHAASLNPAELGDLVTGIRAVSEGLGSRTKSPSAAEMRNAAVARKSIVAATAIRSGERFDRGNITIKRPGNGLAPLRFWSLLGTPADRDYAADELIVEENDPAQ